MITPKVITALDSPPIISIEECRNYLRITPDSDGDSPPTYSHPDDGLILAWLAAARHLVEDFTGLALSPRTLEITLDAFPEGEIEMPWPPLVGIESIVYFDGLEYQTLDHSNYAIDDYQRPGWLVPAVDVDWPVAGASIDSVTIRYTVGFSHYSDDPQTLPLPPVAKAAMLILMAMMYENRETLDQIPAGVRALCESVRARRGFA